MKQLQVDYISDLHIDFYVKTNNSPTKIKRLIQEYIGTILPVHISDTLIIAGDTAHYNSLSLELFEALKDIYKNVIVTFGNHDMYIPTETQRVKYQSSYLKIQELKEGCQELGVHFLDGDKVTIDGIVYGGLCGWYDLPTKEDIQQWNWYMNDSNLIYSGIEYVHPYGSRATANWDSQEFYHNQVEKLKNLKDIDVLITHIAQVIPPDFVLQPQFVGDASNIFYYIDNAELVEDTGCKYYIYGHTHGCQRYTINDIKVFCNPKGYPSENMRAQIKTFTIKKG